MIETSQFEKFKKHAVKATAILATGTGALTLVGCTEQQPEVPREIITISATDSDGNTLLPGIAAIEAVCDTAFRQADELNITDESSRRLLAGQCRTETQAAIELESDSSLVGNKVGVTVRTDIDGFPTIAVVRQK